MMDKSICQTLCRSSVPKEDAKFINDRIKEDYGLNLIIDGLPSSEMRKDIKTGEIFLDAQGFALGGHDDPSRPTLNNHYDIYIQYHARDATHFRVVGVLVYPRSIDSMPAGATTPTCDSGEPTYSLSETQDNQVYYTYSVAFVESDIPWDYVGMLTYTSLTPRSIGSHSSTRWSLPVSWCLWSP